DAAVDLPLDDHRVEHRAAVVHDAVAQDRDLGRVRVGLDDGGVHAVGERRADGGEELAALQTGVLGVRDRRLRLVGPATELGGGAGGLVEGVAQRVGQDGDHGQRDLGVRGALDLHDPLDDLQVV